MTRIVCVVCGNEHRTSPARANLREGLIILAGAVLGLGILWGFVVLLLVGRP